LGVIPHQSILSSPTLSLIRDELGAECLNGSDRFQNLVDEVVVGAMGVHNALHYFKKGVLLITPGDREDILLAVSTTLLGQRADELAGIVLTGGIRPGDSAMKIIREMRFPVLLASDDSYRVASAVHDLTVKTRPDDTEKITLIRDLVARHVNVDRILKAL
jgi:BioD-like phosphotransacetylase family protein